MGSSTTTWNVLVAGEEVACFFGGDYGGARGVESIGGHKISTRFPLHRGFVFDVFFFILGGIRFLLLYPGPTKPSNE